MELSHAVIFLTASYELNLAAKDSPLKIIHHYHPTTRRDLQVDSTLKVITQLLAVIMYVVYS